MPRLPGHGTPGLPCASRHWSSSALFGSDVRAERVQSPTPTPTPARRIPRSEPVLGREKFLLFCRPEGCGPAGGALTPGFLSFCSLHRPPTRAPPSPMGKGRFLFWFLLFCCFPWKSFQRVEALMTSATGHLYKYLRSSRVGQFYALMKAPFHRPAGYKPGVGGGGGARG